jgi:hypothetical protein
MIYLTKACVKIVKKTFKNLAFLLFYKIFQFSQLFALNFFYHLGLDMPRAEKLLEAKQINM